MNEYYISTRKKLICIGKLICPSAERTQKIHLYGSDPSMIQEQKFHIGLRQAGIIPFSSPEEEQSKVRKTPSEILLIFMN